MLLGDPQQLDQPQQGIHPPGAEGSAFDHLLRGHATIGPGQGLFLAETYRLHPDICEFTSEVFYEGRLKPRPENVRQRIDTDCPLNGTGLRLVRVAHTGNQSESEEEVTESVSPRSATRLSAIFLLKYARLPDRTTFRFKRCRNQMRPMDALILWSIS